MEEPSIEPWTLCTQFWCCPLSDLGSGKLIGSTIGHDLSQFLLGKAYTYLR